MMVKNTLKLSVMCLKAHGIEKSRSIFKCNTQAEIEKVVRPQGQPQCEQPD